MLEVLGWIGAWLLALCGAPQAWNCYKVGHGRGLDPMFLIMWTIGIACMLVYILLKGFISAPLIANYTMNLVFLSIILRYKYFPRNRDEKH